MGFDLFSKLRPALIGKMTQRAVLEALRSGGPMSRANLTRSTGISPTTVSNAVAALLRARLLEEGDAGPRALGRPGKKLRLATAGAQVLGVVVDAHECQIVAASVDGRLKDTFTFTTPGSYEDILDALAAHAERLERRGIRTLGLGLSLPGLVSPGEGKAVFSPNLHQTDGRYPARDLKQRLSMPVALMQETDALCLAERSYGAARGIDDYIVLDCGEGLGVGAVIKGQLLEGHRGFAGELGHVAVDPDHGLPCGCGKRGCLETLATDAALRRRLADRLHRNLTLDEALALVAEGNADADAVAQETLEALSIGLATVINLFNPAAVFVHARLLDADERLLERLVARMRRRALTPAADACQVVRGRSTKLQGAVAGFIDHLFDTLGPRLRSVSAAS